MKNLEKYGFKEVRLDWPLKTVRQIRELEQMGFVVFIRDLARFTVDVYVKA